MSVIKILQFTSIINRYDFIDNIVQFADREKFNVGACTIAGHSSIESPVYRKDVFRTVLNGSLSRKAIAHTAWQLGQVLRQWKPDILHTHHYDEALIGYLATRMHRKTRLIVGRHYSDSMYRLPTKTHQKIFLGVEKFVNKKARRIIVPSMYISDLLTKRQKVSPDKIDVIPYGFPSEKFPEISESEIEDFRRENKLDGKITLCTIGRIDGQKGHDDLIGALKTVKEKFSNIHLLIIGEGFKKPEIQEQIERCGLKENVSFFGWRKDVPKIIKSVDIVVHPSLSEAFSSVMCEALWLGKPLIITDVSGATEIIKNGENGIIVPKKNAELLGQAIEKLAGDALLRSRIAENGRIYARQNLCIEKAIKLYENSYLKAVSG